ncbi:MAG: DegT/DnrJ/EryC1/StrS family aminotransferase [Actinobacteria bacterium]|nr:DegT/DnrJ/EryC1/StrS family aminotransferase [Actinomycetota bacterium]
MCGPGDFPHERQIVKVPLVDLSLQHAEVAEEVQAGWASVLERTAFILGTEVEEFEKAFAQFCGVEHCIGVGSGTDAIEIALRAAGVGSGDEVIVPANTFIASVVAILRAGCVPALIDVDPLTHLINVEAVKARIGPRTRAVLPVHLYGQMAPLGELAKVTDPAGLAIVEDAAQSQGASQDGALAGSVGKVAATSFYPGKNLGAYGEAGAVLTNDSELSSLARAIRDHGSTKKYEHDVLGFNSRLDTLQAVVLKAKLRRLADWNKARQAAAALYDELLEGIDRVQRPVVAEGNEPVWHLYVVSVPDRDRVLAQLQRSGVGAGIHYPIPVHLQPALASLGHRRGEFPVSEKAAGSILSLPLFPGITEEQQRYVVQELAKALAA